ncbi:MAG: hypothetical protein JW750_04010 [Anaerolineaceae bacterium]|nr:hypothetical protein [Anaerolineaceae bacterium]
MKPRVVKQFILISLLLLLALSLVGCDGEGVSGSAIGGSERSSHNMQGGKAEGSYKKIKGTYPASYELSIVNNDMVFVDLTASVETGTLHVYLKGPDGQITEMTLAAGETGSINGVAEVAFNEEFRIYYEAVDGEAEGISYSMSYTYE